MTEPPLVHSMLSTGGAGDTSAKLEALAAYDPIVVLFTVLGETTMVDVMLEGVYRVARAYRPNLGSTFRDRSDAFRTRYGAVDISKPSMEETFVRLLHDASSSTLVFESSVVSVSSERPMADGWQRALAELPDLALSVDVIRQGARDVAGMPGEELIFMAVERGQRRVYSTWAYSGVAFDLYRPQCSVQLETPANRTSDGLEAWDRLLDSIRSMA